VEVDLVANNLRKSPQSLTKLLNQIHNDPDSRYLALWRLGALGNRGVEPSKVLTTLQRYSQDSNQQIRFWAVEGLAMLGTEESIDPLLSILAHDPAKQIRERAATNLARSGMLTGEQRLTAVPQLLNLLDDDSVDIETQNLIYAACKPSPAPLSARIPKPGVNGGPITTSRKSLTTFPKNLITV